MDQDHQRRGIIIAIIESGLSEEDWSDIRYGKGPWPDDHRRDWKRFRHYTISQLVGLVAPPAVVVDNSSLVAAFIAKVEDQYSVMTAQVGELNSALASLVKQQKTKIGSNLGKTEMDLFPFVILPPTELFEYVEDVAPESAACKYVVQKVTTYTNEMMRIYTEVPNFSEERHIQPPTFNLTRDIVNHFLPDSEIQFFEKGTGDAVEIRYYTTLESANGLLPISGETDQLVVSNGSPINNKEVKNLDATCLSPNELSQALAQLKGFAEKYKRNNNIEARVFPTSLVSGKRWVFIDRRYADGNEQFLMFPMLETFDVVTTKKGTVCKLNKRNILMVSRMLVREIRTMEKLIKNASKKRKAFLKSLQLQDDEDGTSDDQSDGDENEDQPAQGPASAPPAGGARGAPAGRVTRSASKSAGAGTKKQKTASAGNKKQKLTGAGQKRQKTISAGQKTTHSALTMANLCRHDRNTLWQRAVLW